MKRRSRVIRGAGILAAVLALAYASPSLWLAVVLGRAQSSLARGRWPGATPHGSGQISRIGSDGRAEILAAWSVRDEPEELRVARLDARGVRIRLQTGEPFRFEVEDRRVFVTQGQQFPETGQAWAGIFAAPGMPRARHRWAAAFLLRPRWQIGRGSARGIAVRIRDGAVRGTMAGRLVSATWEGRVGGQRFRIEAQSTENPEPANGKEDTNHALPETRVCEREMDRSIAGALRLAALQVRPVPVEPDGEFVEGGGRLQVREGERILHVSGAPYEMGRQQGVLLSGAVRRSMDRIVYGIGLVYSVSRGEWFLDAARDVIERQRPFVEERFVAEMRGVADGAGVSFEEVRIANFFPELWHCSGAAVFGTATVDGRMLHARVLDYLTYAGLQDEAVLVAARPEGRFRFVNVSYAGFIGSVTGMNERGLAIGEMGGAGYGEWDGVPMALLVRGALEECGTLDAALAYFRDRPRTCEYYYVFSDGPARRAAGVKATPEVFEVIRPGEAHPQLPHPAADTVLLSGGRRYEHLARRVHEAHGDIDVERLIEILRRPVSMGSNLHNVIFEVEDLVLHVAQAGRWTPACDRPYRRHAWPDLFPESR